MTLQFKICLAATLGIYALPLLLSLIDKFAFDFQIGAAVLLSTIAVFLVSFPLYFWGLETQFGGRVAVIVAVTMTVASPALYLNYFIGVTYLFGIMDYDLM